ncbi:hypothetical protein BdWA1_000966 [Babesia duncani]|uniref:Uncharacterized protein n=1 Tax=Babesia duncani TaxID=323732 RepID=A0AAD9PN98_9APIC|nr:hypothetical protein BdWA1_000966 [Babesia duncani]
MILASLCYTFFSFVLNAEYIYETPPIENVDKIKIPEALTSEEFERASKINAKQAYIDKELRDQLKKLGELHYNVESIVGSGKSKTNENGVNMAYQESTIDFMEAPVIFLEPPLILPKQQLETEKKIENILISTGLEGLSRFNFIIQITDLDEANAAIKHAKSELARHRQDRDYLFKRMKIVALKVPSDQSLLSEYKAIKQELLVKDSQIHAQVVDLEKLKHVKAAIIKKNGPGKNFETLEQELESREEELEDADDFGDEF